MTESTDQIELVEDAEKGVPKKDGSGQGVRANRGRGGCNPPEDKSEKQWMQKAVSKPGSFTQWCKSKGYESVTAECITEGKKSKDPLTRKRATLAETFTKHRPKSKDFLMDFEEFEEILNTIETQNTQDLLKNRQFYQDSNGKIIEVWEDGSSYELDFDINNLIGVNIAELDSVQPATEVYKSSNEREPPKYKKNESAMKGKEQKTQDLTEQQYRDSYWKETSQYKLDGSTAMMETRISKCMEATGKSREECSKEVKSEMTQKGSENTNTEDIVEEEEIEKEEEVEKKEEVKKEETKDNIEICPDELNVLKEKAEKYDDVIKDLNEQGEYIKKLKEREAKESEKKLVEKIEKFTNDFVVPDEPINKFIEKWKSDKPIDLITDLHEIGLLISKKESEVQEPIETQDYLTKAEEQWKHIEARLKLS